MESEIKKSLKDAKEAVKNKDFNAAIELCKVILKHDKTNYLALLLSGVSFQETSQCDKALIAFKKATDLQPNQLPAWQGLAAFLEQERSKTVVATDNGLKAKEFGEQLLTVYKKLVELYNNDEVKQITILKKLCELSSKLGHINLSVTTARSLVEKKDDDLTKFVISVLSHVKSMLDENGQELMEKSLHQYLSNNVHDQDVALLEDYLDILMQKNNYEEALQSAKKIYIVNPFSYKALEAICKIFVEHPAISYSLEEVESIIGNLEILNPSNKECIMARAALLSRKGLVMEAKQLLEKLKSDQHNKFTAHLLCEVYKKLCNWKKVEQISKAALEYDLDKNEQCTWKTMLAKGLVEQDSEEKMEDCIKLCHELLQLQDSNQSVRVFLGRCLLRSGHLDLFCETLELAKANAAPDTQPELGLLQAEYLIKTGKIEEGTQLIEKHTTDHSEHLDVVLNAAKILWNANLKDKSVSLFLNVMKRNRDIPEPYVYMGLFYSQKTSQISSMERGACCLEKAFQLEPSLETAKVLHHVYQKLNALEKSMKLLDVLTKLYPKDCHWAWFEKGRLHLKFFHKEENEMEKEKQSNMTISCIQNALRLNTNDGNYWEALGDGYFARGSYAAALKSFQKASELNEKSIYCVYQTAVINQKLGHYEEAIRIYKNLLTVNPNYVPAMKGLAETFIAQGKEFEVAGFTGRLIDCCSDALKLLVQATKQEPQLSCLWSLMGNICLLLRHIPENIFHIHIPKVLLCHGVTDVNDCTEATKEQFMQLGWKFFLRALQLYPDLAALWYNLALSYKACFNYGSGSTDYRHLALMAVKKAITLVPNESMYWNLLGLITAEPAVAQHAFIRAIELNPKTAIPWSNLGVLYLKHENMIQANQAFRQAQNADPFFVPAWVGQANIAEILNTAEAMDLFRHTVAIGSGRRHECQGALGYAQWVVTTLLDNAAKNTPHFRYSIIEMHAVPAAIDGLVKYASLYPEDPCTWNLLGLLYERQGLFRNAENAFQKGLQVIADNGAAEFQMHVDKIKANLARIFTSTGRQDEATDLYASLQESELSSACGIALAHFKAGHYAEAYITYEAALHWLASDDAMRSHLLVAMATSAYRRDFPDTETAKNLLFQSCQLQPPSVYGILALGALGLLAADDTLTHAASQEMLVYRSDSRYVSDISFLSAYRYWNSGNVSGAQREISKSIHMLPNVPELWMLLASVLAADTVNTRKGTDKAESVKGLQLARCAEIALEIQKQEKITEDKIQPQMNLAKAASLISMGYLLIGYRKASLIAAQKAVHCSPHSAASWSVLLAAALPCWTSDKAFTNQLLWLKQLVEHLRRKCDVAAFTGLAPWLGSYERRLTSLLSQA